MIELSHVYKTYPGPVHALRDVDFSVEKGEFVFITGPSGAGKTTLFRMICGFDRPTSGNLHIGNFHLNELKDDALAVYRQSIGVVFQDYKLLSNRSVFDNVALPLLIRGDRPQAIERKVKEMLDWVGLSASAQSLPQSLSGGEQQRASIARALVHQPNLLIADEPTGNLDPKLSEQIVQLLEKVCAQGTTVVVATHDHEMVKRRSKRWVQLNSGQLEQVRA